MQKEIYRLKNYLKDFPNLDIWVISKNNIIAQAYWKSIQKCIKTNKKPLFISKNSFDGLRSENAIILLCGHWYLNHVADDKTFRYYLKNAKITLPIGEIPYPEKNEIYSSYGLSREQVETKESAEQLDTFLKLNNAK